MAEHGDELLAHDGGVALRPRFDLGLGAGVDQAPLVVPTVDRLEQGQPGEEVPSILIALLGGIGDGRDLLAVAREEVECDLVHVALYPQQGREVGLDRDPPADAQYVVERFSEEIVGAPAAAMLASVRLILTIRPSGEAER